MTQDSEKNSVWSNERVVDRLNQFQQNVADAKNFSFKNSFDTDQMKMEFKIDPSKKNIKKCSPWCPKW